MSQVQIKTALLSVYDKTGLIEFARGLDQLGIRLLSTGGTCKALQDAGIPVTPVEDVTQFPEMLDGRVKTLHPRIHAGILAKRDKETHRQDLARHGIDTIDLVCVNLYPFVQVTSDPNCTFEKAIENIDIGGPTMVRASAKNHKDVLIVTSPAQYPLVLQTLKENDRRVDPTMRLGFAHRAFRMTAEYDIYIQEYLGGQDRPEAGETSPFPGKLLASFTKAGPDLRYGENPHQKSALYIDARDVPTGWGHIKQLGGKELSYNNLVDANAALELVMEFTEPGVCVIKHTNPCGAAVDADIVEAYRRAYLGDPNAAMGGIIAVNRPVDAKLADAIVNSLQYYGKDAGAGAFFAEIVIAPDFSGDAFEVLTTKKSWGKDVRLLKVEGWDGTPLAAFDEAALAGWDLKRLRGALLAQTRDNESLNESQWKVMTKTKPTDGQMRDLRFAWLICKHTKSNAIVLAKDGTLAGTGAGQMSRVMSTKVAAELAGDRAGGCVLASDAFFPFRDSIDQAAKVGVKAIVEPGGSKRDDEVIAAADEHKIPLIFTGTRHFRH
ncbi:MAG: bifunctional phosphoribosylaminoimidazolecarboxamide formyltransferase/IMP cyclohydrolase [Phycisphaerae bacterium]|nr:bifunctional phosphoribosylaminoimidazolecarboxamide formyltransferase/IMP cyclohydrolase [Phycisphaerae bacterium]